MLDITPLILLIDKIGLIELNGMYQALFQRFLKKFGNLRREYRSF
jgi:hypothetical protein